MTVATADDARRVLARKLLEQRLCRQDPARLMSWMSAPDSRNTEDAPSFSFAHMRDDEAAQGRWGWQREYFLWLYRTRKTISMKARQLGMSWISCGTLITDALLYPGSLLLVFRQKERDAWDNVERCWQLYNSLPEHLRYGSEVEKPARIPHPIPTGEFRIRFPDGSASTVRGMSSGAAEGHGTVVRRCLMDEFAHADNALDVLTGVNPALGRFGYLELVSTAHGVSDEDTGDGNHFHYVWEGANRGDGVKQSGVRGMWTQEATGENGFTPIFFGWNAHPDRDQEWFENDPEVRALPPHKRAEQYPLTPDDAFQLSNRVFFDPDALKWYGRYRRAESAKVGDFRLVPGKLTTARFEESINGCTTTFRPPDPEREYAIGADVATGRGLDYSAAYVIDLSTMEFVAEFHGRVDADVYAEQLHYLGRYYNTALIAIETAGGYGEAVIIALRDGRSGRKSYPKMYRHIMSSRADFSEAKVYGHPTNSKTRPLLVNGMEAAVRERTLPTIPSGLLREMGHFVRHDTGTSPAAQSGTRDDRVMAACIALEMFRQRGSSPRRRGRKTHTVAARPAFTGSRR